MAALLLVPVCTARLVRTAWTAFIVVLLCTAPSLAGSLPGVSGVGTTLTEFLTWAGYIAGVILIGIAGWDYITHRQLPRALTELVGGLALVILGANVTSILSAIGVTAALVK